MSTPDDHDATAAALTRVGARLRSEADHRPADLDRLGVRIRAARQRTRLALVAGCAVVVLVLVVAVGLRGSGESSLQVGDGADRGGPATEATVPMWTVNPSIPLDPADGEIWAIDVVYDPAVWTIRGFIEDPALREAQNQTGSFGGNGMASYKGEPRVQMYWQGADAQPVAEASRDALVGRAGIVSVEVGPAVPSSRPPATGPVGTGP
jgi:hypothetical protein